MASQVETATALSPTAESRSALEQEDMERMLEFERIIKFRDLVSSGKHPRIKIPPHMVPTHPRTSSSSPRPTLPQASASGAYNTHRAENVLASHENRAAFPGLGRIPTGPAALNSRSFSAAGRREAMKDVRLDPIFLEKSDDLVRAELSLQRERLERKLRAQLEEQRPHTNKTPQSRESLPDFVIDDVLQEARILEESFTPPPVLPGTSATHSGHAAAQGATVSGADGNSSPDDKTFYSSNFSTPEFGLTSRIPIESDNDASMEDSSDYEPELDLVPSPMIVTQPLPASNQQQPHLDQDVSVPIASPRLRPAPVAAYAYQTSTSELVDSANALHWNSGHQGVSGEFQTTDSGQTSSGETSFQQAPDEAPRPPSPFVHANDLLPVAPQPTHISSFAITRKPLPSAVQEQVEPLGRPAQVDLLRRGQILQSSPDSSPQTTGSHPAVKKKGKKKNNKRKAEQAAVLPHIKAEPKSPSPILAPPVQRPYKRQRQSAQESQHYGDDGPAIREGYSDSQRVYISQRPRDERIPVVYEQAEPERYIRAGDAVSHPIDVQQETLPRQEWQVYESRPASFVPQYSQPARPPSAQYSMPPSRVDMRPIRAASHALVEGSSDYPRPAYGGRPGVYESGRVSVRPDAVIHERSRSPVIPTRTPVMGPPPSSRYLPRPASPELQQRPPHTRIAVDEFGREYYEPARSTTRPPIVDAASRSRYEPDIVYERVIPPPQAIRAGSQMPLAYGDDRVVYRRSSPAFAPARRVVTQPEFYEQTGYRQREFSTQPGVRPGPPPDERYEVRSPAPQATVSQFERRRAAEPPQEYMIRASTARPPDSMRYEVPAPGRYIERVGSVRPPGGVPPGHEFTGPPAYGGRLREAPAGSDIHEAPAREYSMRPGPAPLYVEQVPREPMAEYVYADSAPREVYR